jgi:hypothetical protein
MDPSYRHRMTNALITELGATIAEHGPGAAEPELAALARVARMHRVAPVAVDVMIDRTAERVVRERAFAVVLRELSAASASGHRRVASAA